MKKFRLRDVLAWVALLALLVSVSSFNGCNGEAGGGDAGGGGRDWGWHGSDPDLDMDACVALVVRVAPPMLLVGLIGWALRRASWRVLPAHAH